MNKHFKNTFVKKSFIQHIFFHIRFICLRSLVCYIFIFFIFLFVSSILSVLIFVRTNFRAFAQKSEKCARISTSYYAQNGYARIRELMGMREYANLIRAKIKINFLELYIVLDKYDTHMSTFLCFSHDNSLILPCDTIICV